MTWLDATRSRLDVGDVDLPSVERVVIPVDLDDEEQAAARWAALLADAIGARTVFIVPDRYASSERPPYRRTIEQVGTVDRTQAWLARLGVSADEIEMVIGDHDDAVDDQTDEHAIVVVGSDEVAGVTPLAIGSRARPLAGRLECPVIAIPPASPFARGPIVIGVSGRSSDEIRSLAWAAWLGEALDRKVIAVHAVDPIYTTFDHGGDLGDQDRLARHMAERVALRYDYRFGDPADVCREIAEQEGASLLVVSA